MGINHFEMNNLQLLPADTPAEEQAAHIKELMRLHPEVSKAVVMAAQKAVSGRCRLGQHLCRCQGREFAEFLNNGCEEWQAQKTKA